MAVERFYIHIADEILDDLTYRLHHIRWPDQLKDSGWDRGTEFNYLKSLVSYWRDQYDWRTQEAQLNRLSQFCCNIDGIDVHFVHERGKGSNPLSIILTHGWPDSYLRYQRIIPLLTDPVSHGGDPEDSFDVIVPSIPGFGFSSRPDRPGINNYRVSEMWAKLMTEELGYKKFAAAGGDIGSGVTRYLASNHPDLLYGIHLTDIGIIKDLLTSHEQVTLSEEEMHYKKNALEWISHEGGYMSLQSTRPQTLAYGLSDSPAGLAGWIVEKFRAWSDSNGDLRQRFSENELITHIMIYWLTNTIGSSTRMYYENSHSLPPLGYIKVPTGIALFPADILLPPKEWAVRNLNVTRWTSMDRGGHFTAMEEPELLAQDIRAFYKPFRAKMEDKNKY
ncbi:MULTISPECIES: epoxide hydrolase family protein [Paenibacillus]|uniref:epoxide hydrolase family protein n=1 Tax=Paenibacillus TaxID=44249 RepID=UPI0005CE21C8|nr:MULTISPECIES: epoxide hydrolase family protein [Paenibacillus]KAF6582718.1 epoxide hydrolase [Paenibacillus sp. EKM211P]KJD37460.1 multidrug MFS transporter [Paenibacillus polymyxa]